MSDYKKEPEFYKEKTYEDDYRPQAKHIAYIAEKVCNSTTVEELRDNLDRLQSAVSLLEQENLPQATALLEVIQRIYERLSTLTVATPEEIQEILNEFEFEAMCHDIQTEAENFQSSYKRE